MNNTSPYQLSSFSEVFHHGWSRTLLVRDSADDLSSVADLALEARVRSGDYFITLATSLDQLSKETDDYHMRASLEDAISDLIHLQDNYEIVKNSSTK